MNNVFGLKRCSLSVALYSLLVVNYCCSLLSIVNSHHLSFVIGHSSFVIGRLSVVGRPWSSLNPIIIPSPVLNLFLDLFWCKAFVRSFVRKVK